MPWLCSSRLVLSVCKPNRMGNRHEDSSSATGLFMTCQGTMPELTVKQSIRRDVMTPPDLGKAFMTVSHVKTSMSDGSDWGSAEGPWMLSAHQHDHHETAE